MKLARKGLLRFVQIATIGLAFGLAFGIFATLPSPTLAQDRATLVHTDPVRTEQVSRTEPVLGRLVARRAGAVAARIPGLVTSFPVEIGDRLEAGDVIAELDRETLELNLDMAKSNMAQANAGHAEAKAQLSLAQVELKRLEALRKSSAFNPANFEEKQQAVSRWQASVSAALATIASARVGVRLAELELSYSQIKSPYPGVVTQRHTEIGAFLSSGGAVIDLINDGDLEVEADVPANSLSGLTPGTVVKVQLGAIDTTTPDENRYFEAVVRAVIPSENARTRTRVVRFTPKADAATLGDLQLAVNQSVTLILPVGSEQQALTVHKDAILIRPTGPMVFVLNEGKAQPVTLRLGQAAGGRFIVMEGLKDGQEVVIKGNERLRPGQAVRTPSTAQTQ